MGQGGRDGRVGLLAVAGRGVGEAQRVDWDVGMLRRAGRGGRIAQPGGGGQPLSRRSRRAATGRTRSQGRARPRWDRRPGSGRAGTPPGADHERVRSGEVCGTARRNGVTTAPVDPDPKRYHQTPIWSTPRRDGAATGIGSAVVGSIRSPSGRSETRGDSPAP